ncbi:MAG: LD-carboxypeptidase [Alphaproteobacteria bacterium]|nr:LD-carboxypeptidase [Alphaproteobacteria bacterium]
MAILKKGDRVGFIAPSCGLKNKNLTPSINYLKSLGLEVVLADNLNSQYRYMAGSKEQRANTINQMFKDKSIKALFCIRGGAGSSHILELIDYENIKNNPKPIIGLSDSTALQNALITKSDITCFTGFLPLYDFKNGPIDELTSSSLISSLFKDTHSISSGNCLIQGETTGKIIGGCLSVFLQLCGTPYFPSLKGKILLIEDIDEKTYKVDLMLNQLKQQKDFSELKAIIIGQFTDCIIVDEEDGTIGDCIKDFTKDLKIPVISNFQYGHIPSRHIIPLGKTVKLTSTPSICSISW